MPISKKAMKGLRAAVQYNPYGAKFMLGALTDFPEFVVYKDDPFGPIELIINVDLQGSGSYPRSKKHPPGHPFSKEYIRLFETFGKEWKNKQISKEELRDALQRFLDDIGYLPVDDDPAKK